MTERMSASITCINQKEKCTNSSLKAGHADQETLEKHLHEKDGGTETTEGTENGQRDTQKEQAW